MFLGNNFLKERKKIAFQQLQSRGKVLRILSKLGTEFIHSDLCNMEKIKSSCTLKIRKNPEYTATYWKKG